PEVGEEGDRRAGRARDGGEDLVPLAQARRRQVLHLALALHPALAREEDDGVLFDDEGLGVELRLFDGADQLGVALLAPLLADLGELAPDQLPTRGLALEEELQTARFLLLQLELLAQ